MAQEGDFRVKFWGVRGSIACPGRQTLRYGGNTACVEVRCGACLVVLDAGTGLRELGLELAKQGPVTGDLYLTHTHYDHVCGLPFFAPAFNPESELRIWAGHLAPQANLCDTLRAMMRPPLFPVPIEIFRARISYNDFVVGETLRPHEDVTIRTAPLYHPDGSTGYRVEYAGKAVCYVTDTGHVPGQLDRNILRLIRGADIVIYDSMFTEAEFAERPGWGHSTWNQGVRLCDAAGAKRLVTFHHDPERDDDALDAIAAELEQARPGSLVAREGLVLTP